MGEKETIPTVVPPEIPGGQGQPTAEPTPFAPSIFAEARDRAGDEYGKAPVELKLEPGDVSGLIEFPFDVASLVTKYPDFVLTQEESDRLSKLFCKPLEKILAKYDDAVLALAATTLVSVMAEKYIAFRIHNQSSTRDAGEGKDKLPKGAVPAS